MATNPPTLGVVLDGAAHTNHRDAIHIAIAPVKATCKLHPGQGIGFVNNTTTDVGLVPYPLGIVDPFIQSPIYPGDVFYMFLYPNTITSLRHEWTHPAFADKTQDGSEPTRDYVDQARDEQVMTNMREFISPCNSYAWETLMQFAEAAKMDVETLIDHATAYQISGGDHYHTFNFDTPDCFYDRESEFWQAWESWTGRKATVSGQPFSCAC